MRFTLLFIVLMFSTSLSAQITEVTLTYFPTSGGDTLTARATNTDTGLVAMDTIELMESTAYRFTVDLGAQTDAFIARAEEIRFFYTTMPSVVEGSVEVQDTDALGIPVGFDFMLQSACSEHDEDGALRMELVDFGMAKTDTSTAADGQILASVLWTVDLTDDPEAPPCENEEEIITDVALTWTPDDGGAPVVARAQDPDGEGPLDLMILDEIALSESAAYTLTISVRNEIEGEDITKEIMEEADEHMFFFGYTDGVFQSPAGDGNIDNRMDPLNYNDMDSDGLPLGLSTAWSTACVEATLSGTFRLILKHQPGVKSATSTVDDGGTDLDLTFNVSVADDPEAPPCENEEEIITDVILTWTPDDGGTPVVARAQDPDGEGPLDLMILDEIALSESAAYTLTISVRNEIEGEDITEEIMEEADEHMFFFGYTDEVFQSPAGDGNIDNRMDPLNYNDMDSEGLPLGLSTAWSTACVEETVQGTFRLILKHQPGVKSASSTVDDGGTDLDLTFNVSVANDPEAPPCENEEEIITDVILTWISEAGDTVVARAQDPDGEGPLDLEILDNIELTENTTYTMSLTVSNEIEGEDITVEIMEEADEHMFFFGFTEGIFTDPAGDGNIDNRADPVNYNDFDSDGLPVGLSTSWQTAAAMSMGTFRIILKHQPDSKTADSDVTVGGTDIDLAFTIGSVPTSTVNWLPSESLQVFPNPVRDLLFWQSDTAYSTSEGPVRLYNANGQLVKELPAPALQQLFMGDLPSGLYFLQIEANEGVWTKKVFKQ